MYRVKFYKPKMFPRMKGAKGGWYLTQPVNTIVEAHRQAEMLRRGGIRRVSIIQGGPDV